jgi:integrase
MTPRKRKGWLKAITEGGITVRVFEWRPGELIYREVRLDGRRDRKSLGHRDRALAVQQARDLAKRLADLRGSGYTGPLTLGRLWRTYEHHRLPHLSANRQAQVRQHAAFLLAHFGEAFSVDDLSQSHVDAFVAARRAGTLGAKNRKEGARGVRDDTIRQNLNWLAAALAWARGFRVEGRRLLTTDPLAGVTFPREKNVRRPVASEARFRATMAKADDVDPAGRLACLLSLARYTGRRVNALCSLLASDLLLSEQAVTRALAAAGLDPAIAQHMPNGAIRFRAELDKQGYEDIAPLSTGARKALDAYLRAHPRVGDVPLFPARSRPDRAMRKMDALYFLRRAEDRANLPHLERGGFHSYRRLYAVERKHLPDVDVARSAGWRDIATMKRSYQQADPVTTLRAIENAPDIVESATDGQDVGKDGRSTA